MTGRLAHICRHPIKAHGREELASVRLSEGACLPWDRHWAIAHDAAKLAEGWNPCVNFSRGARTPSLMAITSELDEASARVTLRHPDRPDLTIRPDDPADQPALIDWLRPLNPPDRVQPDRVVSAGRGMTDSKYPSVSILSLATLADLSDRMAADLSIHRWRGNLWLDGFEPWQEFGWIGRRLRVGETELSIEERITRCKATSANPETGCIDADTLGALKDGYGHQDFGIFAVVTRGGEIRVGDPVEVL